VLGTESGDTWRGAMRAEIDYDVPLPYHRLEIIALIDLAGTKAAVVTQRTEVRDYLDIHALLTKAKIPLPKMLAAAAMNFKRMMNIWKDTLWALFYQFIYIFIEAINPNKTLWNKPLSTF